MAGWMLLVASGVLVGVQLLVPEPREAGWDALETSYVPVEDGAGGSWQRMGFKSTGRLHDGEPLVRRELR